MMMGVAMVARVRFDLSRLIRGDWIARGLLLPITFASTFVFINMFIVRIVTIIVIISTIFPPLFQISLNVLQLISPSLPPSSLAP